MIIIVNMIIILIMIMINMTIIMIVNSLRAGTNECDGPRAAASSSAAACVADGLVADGAAARPPCDNTCRLNSVWYGEGKRAIQVLKTVHA